MTNKDLLRGAIRAYGERQGDLAKALNISEQSLSYKINSKVEFTQKEIITIAERYNFSAELTNAVFFN